MQHISFNLVEIVKLLNQNRKFLIGISLLACIVAAVSYKLSKRSYKAEAEVYMLNPLYGDRNHILRRSEGDMRFVDYFGTEGDVDKIMTLIASKDVEDSVITYCGLYGAYVLDYGNPRDRAAMHARFKNSFESKRTENASVMCSFEDKDAKRSAQVLDAIVKITDYKFRQYLSIVKTNAKIRIEKKIAEVDTEITHYTDSLIKLREQYQIFDLISPNRKNILVNSIKGGTHTAEGVEMIQNLESIKDQLVINRSELMATANELGTTDKDELAMLHYVSTPQTPNKPSGLGFILTCITATIAVFFFSALLVILLGYIKALAKANP